MSLSKITVTVILVVLTQFRNKKNFGSIIRFQFFFVSVFNLMSTCCSNKLDGASKIIMDKKWESASNDKFVDSDVNFLKKMCFILKEKLQKINKH